MTQTSKENFLARECRCKLAQMRLAKDFADRIVLGQQLGEIVGRESLSHGEFAEMT